MLETDNSYSKKSRCFDKPYARNPLAKRVAVLNYKYDGFKNLVMFLTDN